MSAAGREAIVRALGPPGTVRLVGLGPGVQAAGDVMAAAGWTLAPFDRHPAESDWSRRHGVVVRSDTGPWGPCDLVITSAAISADHPARASSALVLDYPDWLARWARQMPTVAIAGTHGKSTAVAAASHLLPTASVCGGVGPIGQPAGRLAGSPLVVEACEYRRHFLKLPQPSVCILNIEHDHPDCFATAGQTEAAFGRLAKSSSGPIIVPVELKDWAARLGCETVTFAVSVDAAADAAADVSLRVDGDRATVSSGGQSRPLDLGDWPRPLLPSLAAAVAIALRHGQTLDSLPSLRDFPGLPLRFELQPAGPVRWVADYAHHPTAIAATIREARRRWPSRRIVAVVEPHQMARLTTFFDAFAESLALADEVWILPVFAARESVGANDAAAVVERLAAAIPKPTHTGPIAAIADELAARLAERPQAAVVLMGAGRIHSSPLAAVRTELADAP